jgi:hypothetical protein
MREGLSFLGLNRSRYETVWVFAHRGLHRSCTGVALQLSVQCKPGAGSVLNIALYGTYVDAVCA